VAKKVIGLNQKTLKLNNFLPENEKRIVKDVIIKRRSNDTTSFF